MGTQHHKQPTQLSMKDFIDILKSWDYQEDPTCAKLRVLDTEQLTAMLTRIILSEDGMKYYAADALMRLDAHRGVDILLPLLDDPQTDDEMRYHICGLMSAFGDKRAIEPLIGRLLRDPAGNVRAIAAFALGEIGDENVLPILHWVQEHDQGTDFQGTPMSILAQEAIDEILNR